MTTTAPGLRLTDDDLHGSLGDPIMRSMDFLNEVMDRFPDAISFAPGAPNPVFLDDFDPVPHLDRYLAHLREQRGLTAAQARRLLFQYGPSKGLIGDLIAAALRTDSGIDVPAEAVVVTVGCQEAMVLALRALCASADDVLAVVNPCYVGIVGAARMLGIDVVPVRETDDGVDLDDLRRTCHEVRATGRRVRALYVAPDFANPSGTVLDLAARHALLTLADLEDLLVLEDSPYGFTAPAGDRLPCLKALEHGERVLFLGTFAKVCVPGARVGYVVADQVVTGRGGLLADRLASLKSMVTVNTSPICQGIVGGMLLGNGGSLATIADAKAVLYQRNLRLLVENLKTALPAGVRWRAPRGGFFLRLRLPVPADDALLEVSARQYGVLWTPMRHFCLDDSGDHQIRLSCSYLTPEEITEGVRRLGEFLRAATDR